MVQAPLQALHTQGGPDRPSLGLLKLAFSRRQVREREECVLLGRGGTGAASGLCCGCSVQGRERWLF